jgi:hypothetical protein
MNIAKIRRIGRKGKSLVVECEDNEPGIPNVPRCSAGGSRRAGSA